MEKKATVAPAKNPEAVAEKQPQPQHHSQAQPVQVKREDRSIPDDRGERSYHRSLMPPPSHLPPYHHAYHQQPPPMAHTPSYYGGHGGGSHGGYQGSMDYQFSGGYH